MSTGLRARNILQALAGAALAFVLCACTGRPALNPAATLAQGSSQRGAQAFARGDLAGAERDYNTALRIHESLGDNAGRAAALLSLSRIASQAGRHDEALLVVEQLLADQTGLMALTPATRITAYGRAAALHLAKSNLQQADKYLAQADALCQRVCAEAGVLIVLRARSALVRQQPADALALANEALALPALAAVSPPSRQPQASAERANALRVKAQAQAALGQTQDASSAATQALELDQTLGLADRVLPDLLLLAQLHKTMGASERAQHYETLARRAQAASQALRGPAPAN
ncbi:MAG: tetratricopeptide repeat protein [Pseudomonadota bacterium]